jgi:cell division protein FtsN
MAHERNALALSQKLEKLGYVVTIRPRRAPTTRHVVLVEAPRDRTEADALVERLKVEGITALVGESDGRYRVEAGRSAGLDQAIDLAHALQQKGFTPRIASEAGVSTLHMVRVGEFNTRAEAGKSARELRQRGFPSLIVKK